MIDHEQSHHWKAVQAQLQRTLPESSFAQWIEPLTIRGEGAGRLEIEAPDSILNWVQQRFGRLIQECADAVLGPGLRIELVSAQEAADGVQSPGAIAAAARTAVNPRHTFDQFVIGDSNHLAHAAALSVAELPGLAYNPLYLCGPPGLGKTHLLHSIASYLNAYSPATIVRYTTAEEFTNHFLGALHGRDTERFKAGYRDVDVLLVDDVQFLQSKARTEQEFFHTFNALHQGGAQIVLTSDRLPRDLDRLEARLRERFEAGLVIDVRSPDHATRRTILKKRAQQDRIEIDEAALELIADRITDNVRALEGALVRVVAFGSLTGRRLSEELTAEVLSGLYPRARGAKKTTVREIQEKTAEEFEISVDVLLSNRRTTAIAWPRQIAMYLARELTEQTLPALGRAFGGRNHTTILHAHRRTSERLSTDPEARAVVRRLTDLLANGRRDD